MRIPTLRIWTLLSAGMGATAWLAIALWFPAWVRDLSSYELLFLLAPLIIAPLALRLLVHPDAEDAPWPILLACFFQPGFALLVPASFVLAPGVRAAILVVPWLVFCGLIALAGLSALLKTESDVVGSRFTHIGMLYLAVGGAALVLSRAGMVPFGIQEPILLLTAVHFHFTGFAVPVLAGALAANSTLSSSARWTHAVAATGVVTATPLLAAGWLLDSPSWKLICVMALVASIAVLAVTSLGIAVQRGRPLPRALLVVSSASVLFGMVLAGLYGVGEFTGHSLIGLQAMARFHGVANGIGFTLCGLLALNLIWTAKETT